MRNEKVDLLRFIGLAMIILAHVYPPTILFQLRNFDVPLMVLVSGMSFSLSYKKAESYGNYLWKRIKRLLFPVWVFLTFYFALIFLIGNNDIVYGWNTILSSYTLSDGIGYVWVIRVFILVALISPILYLLNSKVESNVAYLFMLFFLLCIYDVVRNFSMPYIFEGSLAQMSLITHYIVPFGIIFAIGLRMQKLNKAETLMMFLLSFCIFILIAVFQFFENDSFVSTQKFKYPPSLYYVSYALAISAILWLLVDRMMFFIELANIKMLVMFISNNSIWVYLWHIPFVEFIHTNFAFKYIIVFSLSVFMTYCQVFIINSYVIKRFSSVKVRNNIKLIFTG